MYKRISGSIVVFLVLYVDDILLIGNDIATLDSVKVWLYKCFFMKDLGDAAFILGIRIYRDRSKRPIELSQNVYIDKILKRFKMHDSKKGIVPMAVTAIVSKNPGPTSQEDKDCMSRVPYVSAIGLSCMQSYVHV